MGTAVLSDEAAFKPIQCLKHFKNLLLCAFRPWITIIKC